MNVTEKRTDSRAVIFYGKLPEDIVLDILSWLPIKSLKRFECACRSWSCHFRTRHFIANHFRHFKQPCLLLHYESGSDGPGRSKLCFLRKESLVLEPAPFELFPEFDIIGSCNGILCLASNLCSDYIRKPAFLLWNPAIGQTRRLPPCKTCFYMGCDNHRADFGWDSVSNDYKVVLLHYYGRGYIVDLAPGVCDVYSCVAESWSTSCVGNLSNVAIEVRSVSLLGCLYWIGTDFSSDESGYPSAIVLAFDLHRNAFEKIRMPSCVEVYDHKKLCIVDEKSLALVCSRIRHSCLFTALWVLIDFPVSIRERSPWFYKGERFTLQYSGLLSLFASGRYTVAMSGDEIFFGYERGNFGPFLINHKTGESRILPVLEPSSFICNATPYVETLIPVSADGFKGLC